MRAGQQNTHAVAVLAAGLLVAVATNAHAVVIAPLVAYAGVIAADGFLSLRSLRLLEITVRPRRDVLTIGSSTELDVIVRERSRFARVAVGLSHESLSTEAGLGRLDVDFAPSKIGVTTHVDLIVWTTVLGIAPCTMTRAMRLTTPLHCGPTTSDAAIDSPAVLAGGLSATRAYEPGDRPNRINWSATARTGNLLVRSAGADEGELVVVVDNTSARDADLGWLSRPASLITTWRDSNEADVRLITREVTPFALDRADGSVPFTSRDSSVVDELVTSHDDLLARLARVTPGPTGFDDLDGAVVFTPSTDADLERAGGAR